MNTTRAILVFFQPRHQTPKYQIRCSLPLIFFAQNLFFLNVEHTFFTESQLAFFERQFETVIIREF